MTPNGKNTGAHPRPFSSYTLSQASATQTSCKITDLHSSALHIGELCRYFSISHSKNVNAAQVPWLAVAHLAIDPQHGGPISADDHFLGLEPCAGR